MTIERLINNITKLVNDKYGSDPTDPGIIISRSKRTGERYVSVIRFAKPFGKDKIEPVEHKARGNNTLTALSRLYKSIKTPQPQLKPKPQKAVAPYAQKQRVRHPAKIVKQIGVLPQAPKSKAAKSARKS
jgi:hypothetical protein